MKKTPRYIFLSKGETATVDFDDYAWLSQMRWVAVKMNNGRQTYAYRSGRFSGTAPMARIIMGVTEKWKQVDHINHDTLDNRRENLRVCEAWENSRNARKAVEEGLYSKYKGVGKKHRGKTTRWNAQLGIHGYQIHLGYFHKEEDAARAYDEAARKFFGEFACLNFP